MRIFAFIPVMLAVSAFAAGPLDASAPTAAAKCRVVKTPAVKGMDCVLVRPQKLIVNVAVPVRATYSWSLRCPGFLRVGRSNRRADPGFAVRLSQRYSPYAYKAMIRSATCAFSLRVRAVSAVNPWDIQYGVLTVISRPQTP